jgi:hypothetical protein
MKLLGVFGEVFAGVIIKQMYEEVAIMYAADMAITIAYR